MKYIHKTTLIGLLFLLSCALQAQVLAPAISEVKLPQAVQTDSIYRGITHYLYESKLFDLPQSINVLEIDADQASVFIDFSYVDSSRVRTSEMAENEGAIAAINGTFFNMAKGGSVCFFQVEGEVISKSQEGMNDFTDNGAVAVNLYGYMEITERPDEGWEYDKNYSSMMASGPVLMIDKKIRQYEEKSFITRRHPRTAVGIREDGSWIWVTVNGRNEKAAGMSIPELVAFMKALGCEDALNLDGGGSTTMWVAWPEARVVSFPSDNRIYDHVGERTVANAVIILPRLR